MTSQTTAERNRRRAERIAGAALARGVRSVAMGRWSTEQWRQFLEAEGLRHVPAKVCVVAVGLVRAVEEAEDLVEMGDWPMTT